MLEIARVISWKDSFLNFEAARRAKGQDVMLYWRHFPSSSLTLQPSFE